MRVLVLVPFGPIPLFRLHSLSGLHLPGCTTFSPCCMGWVCILGDVFWPETPAHSEEWQPRAPKLQWVRGTKVPLWLEIFWVLSEKSNSSFCGLFSFLISHQNYLRKCCLVENQFSTEKPFKWKILDQLFFSSVSPGYGRWAHIQCNNSLSLAYHQ